MIRKCRERQAVPCGSVTGNAAQSGGRAVPSIYTPVLFSGVVEATVAEAAVRAAVQCQVEHLHRLPVIPMEETSGLPFLGSRKYNANGAQLKNILKNFLTVYAMRPIMKPFF